MTHFTTYTLIFAYTYLQHVPRGTMAQTVMKYVLQVYTALVVNKVVIAPHVIIYMAASRPLKQQVGKEKLKYSSVLNMLVTVYCFVERIFCLIIDFNFSLLFIFLYMSQ